MKCPDIENLLSDYIDDVLDEETKQFVDAHLDECTRCSTSLASLTSVVGKLQDAPEVKAPESFLADLHARMDKEQEKQTGVKKILKNLFVPLPIKIPLQFATAAALFVLVVYIFQPVQHYHSPEKIPPAVTGKDSLSPKRLADANSVETLEKQIGIAEEAPATMIPEDEETYSLAASRIEESKEMFAKAKAQKAKSRLAEELTIQPKPKAGEVHDRAILMFDASKKQDPEAKAIATVPELVDKIQAAPIVISLLISPEKKKSAEKFEVAGDRPIAASAASPVEGGVEQKSVKMSEPAAPAGGMFAAKKIPAEQMQFSTKDRMYQQIVSLVRAHYGRILIFDQDELLRTDSVYVKLPADAYPGFINALGTLYQFQSDPSKVLPRDKPELEITIQFVPPS